MKQIYYLMIILSSALFWSCTQDVWNEISENTDVPEINNPIEKDIIVNVMTSKFGSYHMDSQSTRTSYDFTMTPYVEDNDTLMYVVQYSDGWELYSAIKAAPMILFSSPEGKFDMLDSRIPESLNSILRSTIEDLKIVKNLNIDTVNPTWKITGCSSEELNNVEVKIDEELLAKLNNSSTRSGTYIETEGDWVLIETEVIAQNTYESPKLTNTQWGQDSPWNTYTPLSWNGWTYKNSLNGCVAVAVGQYEYYTHYKDGIPKNTVATAVPTADGLDFTFSGSSSTIWDNMAKNADDSGTNYSALLMSYVGRMMSADYVHDGAISNVNMEKYIENVYGVDFYAKSTDYSVVTQSLNKSYPLITWADDASQGVCHCFLIDQYCYTTTQTKYTYGWEGLYDLNGRGEYIDTNDRDEDGNIIGWGVQKEVIKSTVNNRGVSMNWGYYGLWNNYIYYNFSSWSAGGYTFNKYIESYLRKD